jgi:ketosteroid isomerase-like protein
MSAEDLETIRRGIEAYNAGDVDGVVAMADPRVRFRPLRKLLEGGDYVGHDGMRRFMADMDEDWSKREIDVSELRELDDLVLVLGDFHGVGKSGAEVRFPVAWLCEMSEGKLARMRAYSSQDEAFEALGLSA